MKKLTKKLIEYAQNYKTYDNDTELELVEEMELITSGPEEILGLIQTLEFDIEASDYEEEIRDAKELIDLLKKEL